MKSNPSTYNFNTSFARIDEILKAEDAKYEEERNRIPSRDELSSTNGFYVNCTALCVDIRNSSNLPNIHRRPTLAKIYRAYLSEAVAVLNGFDKCSEVNIIGDAVLAIYDTPDKTDIGEAFSVAFRLNSMVKALNCKLRKRDISTIQVGIGIAYGRALMIKAGFKGSGINEVIWMGDVVNRATKLANQANKMFYEPILISYEVYQNLNEQNQGLLSCKNFDTYGGNVVASDMEA